MKYIYLTFLLIATISCKSQTPITNIKNQDGHWPPINGEYFKDINNVLDPFVGTWLYTNGNISLRVILVKKINQFNSVYYEDLIIGGYEYKVSGTTLVNTIPDITTVYVDQTRHKIAGNTIFDKNVKNPPCNDCATNEMRLLLYFKEPASTLTGKLLLRKTTVAGQEAMKLNLQGAYTKYYKAGTTPPPDDFVVPSGDYVLIKQ
ncbi:DUF6705 family protein [Flavobacterium sp.]|uniref:DUF6705 family protein n=1 Tax=Flavobacterium sp. TaxID=239 RepID=UPI00374DF9CD